MNLFQVLPPFTLYLSYKSTSFFSEIVAFVNTL